VTAAATHAAIKSQVETLAASFAPPIPVAWPNKDFQPGSFTPQAERFLQVAIIPAPPQRMTLDALHRRAGSVVITVASRPNNGSGEGDGLADAVAAAFPADLRFTAGNGAVRITAAPSIREGLIDGGFWRTPVVIPFEVLD
jgi:Bacteriophage related domain of unknown function